MSILTSSLKNSFLFFTLILSICFSAFAQNDDGDDAAVGAAEITQANPYTVPFIIPEGSEKYAGMEVDLNRFRPAFIVDDSEASLVFDNYLHGDKYWRAELLKDAVVEKVYLHVVRFEVVSGVTAAHVQLRAKLAEGSEIKLSRIESDGGHENQIINDLVISYEAARPVGESYNFFVGTQDNYMLAGRVASGEQRLSEYESSYTTEQYEVDLTESERSRLLFDAVKLSHEDGLNKFYNSLKPNCVTKAFDILDAILVSRGKSQPEPFLTVISNDPVAGPTIKGLEDRGLLLRRYANLRGELEEGLDEAPVVEARANEGEEGQIEFIPSIEGFPYSIVMVVPEELQDSSDFVKVKATAYNLVPKFIQTFVSNLMINDIGKSETLLKAFRDLGKEMKAGLLEINSEIGEGVDSSFALYLVPWAENNGREVDVLKELGVEARLPLSTFEASMDTVNLNEVHMGLNDALESQLESETNFGFMGVAIQMNLVKDDLSMSVQVVGHLGEMQKALKVENDQVKIDEFVVPEQDFTSMQPIALLDLSQHMSDAIPDLKISFGTLGPVSYSTDQSNLNGKLRIKENLSDLARSYSVPSMRGSASSIALIDVWMDIFALKFDLETLAVSDIDVRVSSGVLGLKSAIFKRVESDAAVNAQFRDAVNNQISDGKTKVGASPGLSLFESIFANNTGQINSGFAATTAKGASCRSFLQ